MSGARTRRVIYTWTSCTPGAATKARAALTSALAVRGLSGEAVSDTVLAVSELVANALEHATGPYEMALRSSDVEPLICEVRDREPRIPALPPLHCGAVRPEPAGQRRRPGTALRTAVRARPGPADCELPDPWLLGVPSAGRRNQDRVGCDWRVVNRPVVSAFRTR